MVKIIAFREDSWFVPATEYQIFNHLANAYGAELQMIREWEEAIIPTNIPIIVCDEIGTEESHTFKHPQDAVYIFGRTHMAGSTLISLANPSNIIKIITPNPVCLWGIQVAAMIFRDRQRLGV